MPDQVDPQVKKQRGAMLRELGQQKVSNFQERFIGQTLPVLFENRRNGELLRGLTDNYIRVTAPGPDAACEKVVDVRLDRVENGSVIGTLVADAFDHYSAPRDISDNPSYHAEGLLQVESA
mgnify:CR=1 FL=1